MRCWILKLISRIGKTNFKSFVDHKIRCCKVEDLHILKNTDTLDT